MFTGQMDYRPNIDAVRWFAADILPLIRQQHPASRFAIVGRAPSDEVRALAKLPGVTVTGEVPDVRPWLAAADAVVAPLLLARGVQNKLLEAMAMARPVVARAAPLAEGGIDATSGGRASPARRRRCRRHGRHGGVAIRGSRRCCRDGAGGAGADDCALWLGCATGAAARAAGGLPA